MLSLNDLCLSSDIVFTSHCLPPSLVYINICKNTHIVLQICIIIIIKNKKRKKIKEIKMRYCLSELVYYIDQINRKIFSLVVVVAVITLFGCLEQRMKIVFLSLFHSLSLSFTLFSVSIRF